MGSHALSRISIINETYRTKIIEQNLRKKLEQELGNGCTLARTLVVPAPSTAFPGHVMVQQIL